MSENRLKILQVNSADIAGGAEKVSWSLFQSYRRRGHKSWLAVGSKHSSDSDVFVMPNHLASRGWARFWWQLSWQAQQHQGRLRGMRSLRRLAEGMAEPAALSDALAGRENFHFPAARCLPDFDPVHPDVIHCHNLHGGYFNLRALPFLSAAIPMTLTLHDGWLLSGHCAHSFECMRWVTGCGSCPDLNIYPAVRRDATAENWRQKRDIYASSRMWVAAPSRWLLERAMRSMLAQSVEEACVIPNGVDLTVFRPGDQVKARRAIGLPPDGRVALIAGHTIRRNEWKDYATLVTAIQTLAQQIVETPFTVLVLGEAGPAEQIGSVDIRHIGFENDAAIVAAYYQAADVYLHAAKVDTFPTTVLEALACGTAVVATAVGGIPEQIDDGQTGFLTPAGDGRAMAERATALLNKPDLRQEFSGRAAEAGRRRFDLELQVDRYLTWYDRLMSQFHARRAK
ncbi:MAG TPA: glycosyltransferase [Aggregatilineales bacterium]|nr:glycosyltransferase [Aggregatilineales bacterium]